MKIATFNVNGVRSRLDQLLAWLERDAPDIACLHELKSTDAAFPIETINDAGYGALWCGQSAWNGVAILARGVDPVESRRGLPGDTKDTQSRYLEDLAARLKDANVDRWVRDLPKASDHAPTWIELGNAAGKAAGAAKAVKKATRPKSSRALKSG